MYLNKLLRTLPPFSPDYSGTCSALFELGGLLVINDAAGCTGNYTGFDEPRWYGSKSAVFSSGLREMDAIMGDDKKLINKVADAVKDFTPRFIALMGSPVPMVIGSDMYGIAREMEYQLSIPVFGFNTCGIAYYDKGISEAFMRIAKRFLEDKRDRIKKGINILGATPLDMGITDTLKDIKTCLKDNGFNIISCWAMDSSLEQLKNSTCAEKNLVVSWSGLTLAKYMKEKYNIPYVTGIPIGENSSKNIISKLEQDEYGSFEEENASYDNSDAATLIIGEQISSNSLRDYLRKERKVENIKVASFFSLEPALMEKGDFFIESEYFLEKHMEINQYENIFGDPLFKQLISPERLKHYFGLPHIPVSSRLCWKHAVSMVGSKVNQYINI